MSRVTVCLCLIATAAAGVATAMGPMITWAGGTPCLMAGQPTISLTSEKLLLEPQATTTLVTVRMQFQNRGDACTAQMGFPMLEYEVEYQPGYHVVKNFAIEVDGEPLEFTEAEESHTIRLSDREPECEWYLFSVPFGAGETREVRVRYDERRTMYNREVRVPYILATGTTWHGAAHDLQLEVRPSDRENFHNMEVRGDEEPLEVSERGSSLVWQAAEYDGDPEVLWFTAALGPKSVKRDDGGWVPAGHDCVRWRRGVLLVETDLLCGLLLAQKNECGRASARLTKEEQAASLDGWELPVGHDSGPKLFVDARPAFREFGGGIEVTRDDAGDAVVQITTLPDSEASARATAYFLYQNTDYRLKCLHALANRWPEGLTCLCEEIVGRQALESPAVLLWLLGYVAGEAPELANVERFVSRMRSAEDGNRVAELAKIAVSGGYETIARGGGMALAQLDPEAATLELLLAIPGYRIWYMGKHRARRAGLAMRLAGDLDAAEVVMALTRDYGECQAAEDAMIALGFLGDDAAIEFLVEMALGLREGSLDMKCAATEGLSLIGTPAALAACADVWQRIDNREVRYRALRGFEFAMGYPGQPGILYLKAPPEWARQMSVEEACRISLPLLEGLMPKAEEIGRERSVASLIESARQKLADLEAAGGGG